jgi:Leucine-rich repeat (LRR) protein
VIPTFISQLISLEVLIASHNKLISLPEEMGVLDKLMEIVSINRQNHPDKNPPTCSKKTCKPLDCNAVHPVICEGWHFTD